MMLKRNVIFALETRKRFGEPITEHVPIRMRLTYKGQRIDIPIGYGIDASKWDSQTQRVRNNVVNKLGQSAREINQVINEYEDRIVKLFVRYELDEIEPSVDEIKMACKKLFSKTDTSHSKHTPTLLDYFDEFMLTASKENFWTPNTYAKIKSVRKHLYDFNPVMSINAFDADTITEYLNFLQQTRQMRNSTIKKQLGLLKWFLRWAVDKGYSTQLAFTSYKYKGKSTENKRVIFLTYDELMRIYTFQIPEGKKYLERTRDVFCFCCFTSLRYSDVRNLCRSNIIDNRIEITTIKTCDALIIDLNKYSRQILDKYKDVPFPNDKALPVISNQKMNDYIKELGELAGINTPVKEVYFVGNERREIVTPKYALLSTHAGRRTFICCALTLGISPQIIMKWTGHSDYKAMKPYIDIADADRAAAMNVFNEH